MSYQYIRYDNISQLLTLAGVRKKNGRHTTEEDLGIIRDASCVVDPTTNTIIWMGPTADIPGVHRSIRQVFSSEGEIWLPELVECHTHLVFAGSRFHDYALRCQGKSYADVAAAGGGILSTLAHTRKASLEELVTSATTELERFQKYGIGTIEIKSGYGLDWESELKILECVRILQEQSTCTLVPTFMAAHAVPPEHKGKAQDYVDLICKEWIPEVAEKNLATFVDVFIEDGYFTVAQGKQVAEAALTQNLKVKLHVDQFKNIGGTSLGLDLNVTSLDHLDNVNATDIQRFGNSNTVAVLLPGASLFTGTPYPPARALIDSGARVALSTDYNPGTCPSRNLPLMTTLACSQMKMTLPESIAAITYNAAAALNLENELGTLEVGRSFRVCQLKADSYEVLAYCFGELE